MTPLNLLAVALILVLVACQHPRSENQAHSAATPSREQHVAVPARPAPHDAHELQRPADEWTSCDLSNAVCSGTPHRAGAEVMDSAAPTASSAAPAIADPLVSVPLQGPRDPVPAQPQSPLGGTGVHAARTVAALSSAGSDFGYWYAWVAVLVLVVLLGWWSRRRTAKGVTPAGDASAHAEDVIVAAASSAEDAAATERVAQQSIPLGRLTFTAVDSTDDTTDREIGLPKAQRSSVTTEPVANTHGDAGEQAKTLGEAKRLLTAARHEDALHLLEPLLAQPQPPDEAWLVAGWAWWRMAQAGEPSTVRTHASSAAHAFTQAWQHEQGRADLLTRIARCHLLRARYADAEPMRRACLDQAIDSFAKRSALRADEPADQLELAQVAAQRASACERGDVAGQQAWWQRAALHLAQIPQAHALWQGESVTALRIDVQLGLAATATGAESVRQHDLAVEQLRLALASADETSTDAWLAKLIDTTRAKVKHQSGGGRLLTLQSLQLEVAPHLHRSQSVAPLLAWINLLDDWARMLPAHAAQAKLAEADELFERASQMPSQGPSGLLFARAYYLRARSRHEQGASCLRTLQQAHHIVIGLPEDALPASILKQELAEIELALARHRDSADAAVHYRRAVAAAEQAAADAARPGMAWHCAAKALLGLSDIAALDDQQRSQLSTLATQLETAADNPPEALRTAAEIRLRMGDYANSSRLCEAAWNAGATRTQLLPLWQQADAEWARTTEHASDDAGWNYLHQRLRLASTIY